MSGCNIDPAKEVEKKNVKPNELTLNTQRIKDLTQQIRDETDCNALKMKVQLLVDDLKEEAKSALQEQKKQMEKILPILKLPSPTPWSIVKWLGKLVTGTAIPQLEAYIKYVIQIAQLLAAVAELVRTVQGVLPRLKACALDIKNDTVADIRNSIDGEIAKLQNKIENEINDAVCDGLKSIGISTQDIQKGLRTYQTASELLNNLKTVQSELKVGAQAGLSKVAEAQNLIQESTGIEPMINTSSVEGFTASVQAGHVEEYKAAAQTYIELVPPSNVDPAYITGDPTVGVELEVHNGSWTGSTPITFTYKWKRGDEYIPGAETNKYTLTPADVTYLITCEVIADNPLKDPQTYKTGTVGPIVDPEIVE